MSMALPARRKDIEKRLAEARKHWRTLNTMLTILLPLLAANLVWMAFDVSILAAIANTILMVLLLGPPIVLVGRTRRKQIAELTGALHTMTQNEQR